MFADGSTLLGSHATRTSIVPVLRHGLTGWDTTALPSAEFERRIVSLRERLGGGGYDQVLVYSNALASGPVAYLSNFHVSYPARGALLQITATDAVLFAQMPTRNAKAMQPHVNLPIVASSSVRDSIDRILATGAARSRVAVCDLDNMLWRDAAYLEKSFDEVEAVDWVADLRRVKSSPEQAVMRRSAEIAQSALAAVAAQLGPRSTESELAALADYTARSLGCQDTRVFFASDHDSAGLLRRPATQGTVSGDAVRILIAVQWRGYWTELGDTLAVTAASDAMTKARALAMDRLNGVAASLPDGADTTGVLWLHGIGLDSSDLPSDAADGVAPGDCVTVATVSTVDGATAFVASTALVGAHGAEFFTALR